MHRLLSKISCLLCLRVLAKQHKNADKSKNQVFQELELQHMIQRFYHMGNVAIPKAGENFTKVKLCLFTSFHFFSRVLLQIRQIHQSKPESFRAFPSALFSGIRCMMWQDHNSVVPLLAKDPPGYFTSQTVSTARIKVPDGASSFMPNRQNDKSIVTFILLFI